MYRIDQVNWDRLIQRMLGRATCRLAADARLGPSARIRNALGDTDAISIGDHSIILGDLVTFGHGGRVSIGEWCYVGEGARLWSGASITVGDRTLISHGVNVFDNLTHPLDPAGRHQQYRSILQGGHPREIDLGDRPVSIGADVLLCANSIVLRGVSIGDRAVIGAGSVVTKDVAPDTIVAGNPARVIRELDESER